MTSKSDRIDDEYRQIIRIMTNFQTQDVEEFTLHGELFMK